MGEIWARIEEHLQLLAPECHAALPPGASADRIEQLESMLDITLPDDVRASWMIHDGSGEKWILPGGELLSLRGIVEQWYVWHDLIGNGELDDSVAEPHGPIQPLWWNLKWFPVTNNGGGDHHCVDTDPAPGGEVGQIIAFGHDVGPECVLAGSFREYLLDYADRLAAGEYHFDEDGVKLGE